MRVRIICEGKAKDEHLRALQADYTARIAHFADLQVEEIRAGGAAQRRSEIARLERRILEKTKDCLKVALDPRGQEWTSTEFARWMAVQGARGTRELVFLVGGPDGFSEALRGRVDISLALSRMTLTRDWARTLLLEQIYRAFTIDRGYPYPR